MPGTPNAGRKKVRCPKCTALFSEPAKPIFECPICSCRLSANGVVAANGEVASTIPYQAKEKECGQTKAADKIDEGSRVHSQEGCESDVSQRTPNDLCEENRGPLPNQICKEEQQPITQNGELSAVPDEKGKEGKPLGDETVEDLYANKDSAVEDNYLNESRLPVVKDEVIEGEDSVEKSGASKKGLQLQLLQTTRCEFSFKYSLEGASPVESKRLPPPKSSLSEKTEHNNEASDVPLHAPLRVRISNTREESSDQSEHGRYSFGSDTDSHDGSESDFDFPAPWADGLQDKVLPDSSGQNQLFQHHLKQAVAATPHQLELRDVDDASANQEYALQESSKHSEGSDAELPLQVGDAAMAMAYSGRENELRHDAETSNFDHLLHVNDLVNIVSSATLGQNQILVESSAAIISSNQQDSQFVSSLHNISSVDEEVAHTYAEPDARIKNTLDHLLPQDTELELDLYSHHNVDEWQRAEIVGSPSKAHYYAPAMENQSLYPDQQRMEGHPSGSSEYAVSRVPLANSQPYVVTNPYVSNHLSFGASSSNQMYTYQVPSQPLIFPAAFQNHAVPPFAYHPVSNACMLYSHHQHPYMQTHLGPHCAVCVGHSGSLACNHSGPMACNPGQGDHWSYHQAHHGPALVASSLVACTPKPINQTHRYDFPSADLRLQASLSGRVVSQYPPLPKDGAAPYFACKGCNRVLQVPLDLPPNNGIVQKLRCSACNRVTKFSAKQQSRQRQVVSSSPSLELNSREAYALPQLQSNAGSTFSSYNQNVLPVSSWKHDQSSRKPMSQVNRNIYVSTLSSQGANHVRGNLRECIIDNSINAEPSYLERTSSMTGMRSAQVKSLRSRDSVGFARTRQDAAPSPHAAVDEKDEGLDFGAPRISDGDSLDQSESRMRSPENIQAQRTCAGVPEDVPLGDFQAPGQVSKLDWSEEPNSTNQVRKPGSPLLVLLNQESTRFTLSLDPTAPTEEFESASWSPASDSPLTDNTRNRLRGKERHSSQSRKGAKYIAGLLRRSLRDLSK